MVEHALAHIEEAAVHHMPAEQQRWYAVKIFERDEKVLEQLQLKPDLLSHIEQDIRAAEEECDDDARKYHHQRTVWIHRIADGKLLQEEKGGDAHHVG